MLPRIIIGFWQPRSDIDEDDPRVRAFKPEEGLVLLEEDIHELAIDDRFFILTGDPRVTALLEHLNDCSSSNGGSVSTTPLLAPDEFTCIEEIYNSPKYEMIKDLLEPLARALERCRGQGGRVQVTFD